MTLPMLWVGGAPGAGKSTLARDLALAEDLPVHALDLWTYDHVARLPTGPSLDDDLASGPEGAADSFERQAALRMPLLHEDLATRDLGEVPALVEGPQLHPRLWPGAPAGSTVWLVPAAVRTRAARENRTACRQGRLWQQAAGIAALPPFPFACECGRSGCAATWATTPDAYDAATRSGRLVAHDATGAVPGA